MKLDWLFPVFAVKLAEVDVRAASLLSFFFLKFCAQTVWLFSVFRADESQTPPPLEMAA